MEYEEFLRLAANPNINLKELRDTQEQIAHRVILQDDFEKPIKYIGGVDSAYLGNTVITAYVNLKWDNLKLIEQKCVISEVKFPYISSYFAFREGPPILEVLSRITLRPTILMINSHGILHPSFAGCASHIGVLINLPTIGVAKERLCGKWETEPTKEGDWVPVLLMNRIVGARLLSKRGMKPIFISVGHRITLQTCIEIVRKTLVKNKFPKPLELAHNLAVNERKILLKERNT